ncbi:acyltransferase family protein [Laribacter hongkongensis]|uniref:Acyltransferase n=1 Tax=Laribacter hongkongensis TaxID=168471 RepID=A0ABD4SS43_9NEIS|nr:acyltransferase [Laribacter hongkongensis]MCG9026037.1 acyltransferase [Laribacter hongkongensis]MCG9116295.1 acyltransferase [Laribacter hongkongensis]MCG9124948.1 acyltransferase [Laribacter hongkongensis]
METGMRVHGFDILRGLCALGVACYHVLGWLQAGHPYNLGLYGVYVFFVLSGASLWIAYADKMTQGYPLLGFFALRFFRLAPLYWLAVLLTPVIVGSGWNLHYLALNLSFLFGFGNPGQTAIVTGGWSLGIEFVFYLLFPVLLVLARAPAVALRAAVLLYFAQMIFIAVQVKDPGDLGLNWVNYTQVMSFVFYFYAGMLVGQWLSARPRAPRSAWLDVVLFVALAACLVGTSGAVIEDSLTGARRYLLPFTCVGLVMISAHLFAGEQRWLVLAARWLGNSSYGVYLLHPLVFSQLMKKHTDFANANPYLFMLIVLALSFVLALLVEHWLERPLRDFGKRHFGWLGRAHPPAAQADSLPR